MKTLLLTTVVSIFALVGVANAQYGRMSPVQEYQTTTIGDLTCAVYYEQPDSANAELAVGFKNIAIQHGREHNFPLDQIMAYLQDTHSKITAAWTEINEDLVTQISQLCTSEKALKRAALGNAAAAEAGNQLPQ